MNTPKEAPGSGGNHPEDLGTQNTNVILPVLAMLERIAIALERSNEVLLMQKESLDSIDRTINSLREG